jgi:site-specific DNA recombinase
MPSMSAAEGDEAVVAQVRLLPCTPEIIARTWAKARRERAQHDVLKTITDFAPLWDELFSAEQARIIQPPVERVDLARQHPAAETARRGGADAC